MEQIKTTIQNYDRARALSAVQRIHAVTMLWYVSMLSIYCCYPGLLIKHILSTYMIPSRHSISLILFLNPSPINWLFAWKKISSLAIKLRFSISRNGKKRAVSKGIALLLYIIEDSSKAFALVTNFPANCKSQFCS